MRSNLFRSVFASALAATFLAAAPSAQGSTATVEGTFRCGYQQQVLTLVNQERAAYGLPAFTMTDTLTSMAMIRAGELWYEQSHDRPNGEECFSIIPGNFRSENLAVGQTTPEAAMYSWMTSTQGHREAILNTKWSYIGIGCFVSSGQYYWIQVFSDSPGEGYMPETRTADYNATVTIALDTSSSSYYEITGISSGGSSSGGSSSGGSSSGGSSSGGSSSGGSSSGGSSSGGSSWGGSSSGGSSSGGSSSGGYCTISFNANGGKGKMAKQTVEPGVPFTLRKNAFTRSGYVFIGWAESKGGPVVVGNRGTGTAGNAGSTTLYAKWAKKYYKVAFYRNGGKGKMAKQKMTYGKAKKLLKNKFTRKGYTFMGWSKSKNGTAIYKNKQKVKNLTTTGKTVKLYAKWASKTSANYCTTIFKANGGKGKMAKQKIKMGTWKKLRKNTFTRSGYVFLGWSHTKNGYVMFKNQHKVYANPAGTKTVTLYAIWKKK